MRDATGQSARVRQPRPAAVILAIFADPPHPVVFVERAAHLRDHPGQIGFPGGAVDPADGDDRERTARRELEEELGVAAGRVTIVGRLPDAHQRSRAFIVTPFVGVLPPHTALTIDPTETAAVFTVPLEAITAPGAVRRGTERVGDWAIQTWLFDYGTLHVWGLTAGILHDFVTAWSAPHSVLRRAVLHELHAST